MRNRAGVARWAHNPKVGSSNLSSATINLREIGGFLFSKMKETGSTKRKGNIAEASILAEFVKNNIPVLLPFGDNEKYDLVIDLNGEFKSIQIKCGSLINGCITADVRHRIGVKRIKYESYIGKVDLIAIWCNEIKKAYLIPAGKLKAEFYVRLRIDKPKINYIMDTIVWAKDHELDSIIKKLQDKQS